MKLFIALLLVMQNVRAEEITGARAQAAAQAAATRAAAEEAARKEAAAREQAQRDAEAKQAAQGVEQVATSKESNREANVKSAVQTPSVTQSAQNAGKDNSDGSFMSSLASAAFMAAGQKFMSCCGPKNPGCCAAAVAMFMKGNKSSQQAGANADVASGAFDTASNTYGYDYQYTPGISEERRQSIKDAQSTFGAVRKELIAGTNSVKFDPKTGIYTDANGKKYTGKEFESAASMAAAGMSSAFSEDLSKRTAAIEKQVMEKAKIEKMGAVTPAMDYNEGGYGAGGSGGDTAATDPSAAGSMGLDKASIQREVASAVVGMSKNYNGNPIGVSVDSIFLMMTRRYKLKERQNNFFDETELLLKK